MCRKVLTVTDPYHGEVRVNEMKQMIKTLHENGIRVNMDVVYNHTYHLADYMVSEDSARLLLQKE